MYISKVLISIMDASIYMRMSTDMIIPDGGKAKATLGATAHATACFIRNEFLQKILVSGQFGFYVERTTYTGDRPNVLSCASTLLSGQGKSLSHLFNIGHARARS